MAIDDVDYTASGYIEAITPDGVVISRHRQEREAQQACFQHAKDNEDLLGDGVHEYTIRPAEIRMSIRLLSPVGAPNNGEVDVTPPLAPAGVGVDEIGAGSARVFWASNLEPDILDYRVYLSTTSASTGFSLWETTSNTESTVTGLSEEQEFWVRVTARDNALNESEYSATVTGASLQPVWIDASELASLPTSGTVWDELETRAYSSFSGPAGGNNDIADTNTLATALVAATGDSTMLTKCQGLLDDAVTDAIVGDTSLSACRNLTSYAIAADLIGYEDTTFVNWMKTVVARDFESWGAGQDGNSTGEGSIFWKIWKVNNHGSMALACFAAISRYLQRIEPNNSQWQDNLDHVFQCLRYYMGEEPGIIPSDLGYTGKSSWNYGPNSENWQQLHDSNYYVIYPQGATDGTNNIDGLLPEAARRGSATYVYPAPSGTTYYWEFLQGLTVALHIMDRAGYSVLPLGNYAHRRAIQYLYDVIGTPITGDDAYQAPLIDFMYGVSAIQSGGLWDQASVDQGKNMGWTGWTHGARNSYSSDPYDLSGFTNLHFTPTWPAEVSTSQTVAVTPATIGSYTGTSNIKLELGAGNYGSLSFFGNHMHIELTTGVTISSLSWSGAPMKFTANPVRTGLITAFAGRIDQDDVLFDGVVIGTTTNDPNFELGPSDRFAMINSDFASGGWGYTTFFPKASVIFANNRLRTKMNTTDITTQGWYTEGHGQLVMVDNLYKLYNNGNNTISSQTFRLHSTVGSYTGMSAVDCYMYVSGNQFEITGGQSFQLQTSANPADPEGAAYMVFEGNDVYVDNSGGIGISITGDYYDQMHMDNNNYYGGGNFFGSVEGALPRTDWQASGNSTSSFSSFPAWTWN